MSVDWMKILGRMLFGWGFVVVGAAYYWFATFVQSDHVIPVVFGYFGVAMTSAALIGWSLYEGKQVERLRAAVEIAAGFRGHTSQSTYWMEQSQIAQRLLDAEVKKNTALTDRLRRCTGSKRSPPLSKSESVATGQRLEMLAWAPSGITAPIELTAVWIRAGLVTEQAWWQALSDRVTELAMQATRDEILRANSALGSDVASIKEPQAAGQVLVEGNLNLRTWISLSVLDESPFPAQVLESDPEAEEALSSVDLQSWAELARAQTSSSGD
jgi:hypothetical protein